MEKNRGFWNKYVRTAVAAFAITACSSHRHTSSATLVPSAVAVSGEQCIRVPIGAANFVGGLTIVIPPVPGLSKDIYEVDRTQPHQVDFVQRLPNQATPLEDKPFDMTTLQPGQPQEIDFTDTNPNVTFKFLLNSLAADLTSPGPLFDVRASVCRTFAK